MASSNIPEKTIERLSEYRRTLLSCHKQGITHIFSHVLAGIHGITAVQVRRDLMLIGFSSDTKKGYDVKVLIDFISNILDSDTVTNIAVIGMGHLGQAITKYFNGRGLKLKITTAFDIDPAKVGQTIDGIPCHHMETFEEVVEDKDIDIVIVSSPSRVADELVVPIVNAGIKGVLNFTSRHRGRELRHHHTARKGRLFRQGERGEPDRRLNRGTMKVFHGIDRLPAFRHPAATVGSFDGVHGGHSELLAAVRRFARERDGESIVVTFSPHPRIVLETQTDLRLLTTLDEKAWLLERAGIDNLVVIPFTREFSRTGSADFIRRDLIGKLGVETLVMGYNHHFGHNKEGDYGSLRSSERPTLRLYRIEPFSVGGEKVSSTVVRSLVEHAEMARAARMLGHPYLLMADVARGSLRIDDPYKLLPPAGEYPVTADGVPARLFIPSEGAPHLDRPFTKEKSIIEFTAL